MTTFAEQMTADLAVFFNTSEHGKIAVFTPVEGAQKDCTIVLRIGDELNSSAIGNSPGAIGEIQAKVSEVGNPEPGGYFTLMTTSESWRIVRVIERDDYSISFEVARETRMLPK